MGRNKHYLSFHILRPVWYCLHNVTWDFFDEAWFCRHLRTRLTAEHIREDMKKSLWYDETLLSLTWSSDRPGQLIDLHISGQDPSLKSSGSADLAMMDAIWLLAVQLSALDYGLLCSRCGFPWSMPLQMDASQSGGLLHGKFIIDLNSWSDLEEYGMSRLPGRFSRRRRNEGSTKS
jgi:hypothetical protein